MLFDQVMQDSSENNDITPTTDTEVCPNLLLEAIKNNNVEIIKTLFCCEANVSFMTKICFDHIDEAIRGGNIRILKILLTEEVDVNIRNEEGYTPIFTAVQCNNNHIVNLLINNGANVNVRTQKGFSPIHEAVQEGNIEVLDSLLNKGADINARTSDDNCTAHYNEDLDQHHFTEQGVTPIYNAVCNEDIDIVKFLIDKGANVNAETAEGYTPLITAVEIGNIDLVQILVSNGAAVNNELKNGEIQLSPLYMAIYFEHEDIAVFLLNNGADVKDETTLIYEAIETGNSNLTKILLNHGAQVNINAEIAVTPLHYAVEQGHEEIAKILLDNGANVNAESKEGVTPLHEAVRGNCKNLVEILLNYGADHSIKTYDGDSPVYWAFLNAYEEVVNILLDSCADVSGINRAIGTKNDTPLYNVVLPKYIIKLKYAGLNTNEENCENCKFDLVSFQDECREEIIRLKYEIISYNISLYDILTKGIRALIPYMQYNCSVKKLESKNYEINFPIYGGMLNSRFHNLQRKELLAYGILFFDYCIKDLPILPFLCSKNVLKFLRNQDLRILIGLIEDAMEHKSDSIVVPQKSRWACLIS